MPTLGKFIQRRRMQLGLTQEQLAERIGSGVRQSEISRLEHDRIALPRRQRLEQIALALDVSLGELLARSGWADADVEFTPAPAPVESASAPAPVVANGTATVEEAGTLALSEAIARAEQLIADSDALVEKSQVTFDQARRSVRYGRRREPLSQ